MNKTIIFSLLGLISTFSSVDAQNQKSTTALTNAEQSINLTEHESYLIQLKENRSSFQNQDVLEKVSSTTPNPSCTNMDFESGNANGWSVASASTMPANFGCNLTGCCSGTNTSYKILSNGYTDYYFSSTPINSQFGSSSNGNKFLKLGDSSVTYPQKLSQSFSVTPSNSLFRFAYKWVLRDGAHPCCEQPFFRIQFKDHLGNLIPFTLPNYSVVAGPCPSPPAATVGITVSTILTSNPAYTIPWFHSAVDLSPYIGKSVSFELIASPCTNAAHFGYTYFDAMCSSLTYSLNNNANQLDSLNNICVNSFPAALSVPAGFDSYIWTTSTGTISGQNLNVTTPGSYTLAIVSTGACCPTYKVFNVSLCTGITDFSNKSGDPILFPNPSNSEITLMNIYAKSEIIIVDVLGNVVSKKIAQSEKIKIDVSDFNQGVYYLKINSAGKNQKTLKLVKE